MSTKLLLVDDSVMVRSGLETALKKNGLFDEIIVAENGQKGLEMIQSEKPSVVLLDIEMPVMDGLTALKEIGKKKKSGEIDTDLPVIVLSGTMYENDENVRKAKMLGAADVVAKPEGKSATLSINVQELEERIKKVL
jgi:YesN/AraC family two-component response regulator